MDINKNLGDLMKEAQKMQERMQKAQEELTKLIVRGEAGGGMVVVEMNGRHYATKVTIKPTLLEEDVEMLEDLVAAAINNAVNRVEVASKEKISQLTAGFNLPPDFLKDEDKE